MQKLRAIQQRVFCIFLRLYQRSSKNKIIEVDFDMLAWRDPTVCPPCETDGFICPPQPSTFKPIGPSPNGTADITNPMSDKYIKYYREALQYYNPLNISQAKTFNIFDISRKMQPFNEDMMFTEDLWFLHSTWTSFEKAKLVIRSLIDTFGYDAVMMTAYIPLDIEILPNK